MHFENRVISIVNTLYIRGAISEDIYGLLEALACRPDWEILAILVLLFCNFVDKHGPQLVGVGGTVGVVPPDFPTWKEYHLHLAYYSDKRLAVEVVGDKHRKGTCLGYPLLVAPEKVVEVLVRVD